MIAILKEYYDSLEHAPSLEGPWNPTMDDVKRAAEEYNKTGEQAAKAGLSRAFTLMLFT